MQTAETVLNIIRDRGQRGLPLERLYRQLYNRDLYLRAYGKLYANKGAMTPGATPETVDGMSLTKIDNIINAPHLHRQEAFNPTKAAWPAILVRQAPARSNPLALGSLL
jgi:hypothetical protein